MLTAFLSGEDGFDIAVFQVDVIDQIALSTYLFYRFGTNTAGTAGNCINSHYRELLPSFDL